MALFQGMLFRVTGYRRDGRGRTGLPEPSRSCTSCPKTRRLPPLVSAPGWGLAWGIEHIEFHNTILMWRNFYNNRIEHIIWKSGKHLLLFIGYCRVNVVRQKEI